MDKMAALAPIYIPLDGMNEMGLCLAEERAPIYGRLKEAFRNTFRM